MTSVVARPRRRNRHPAPILQPARQEKNILTSLPEPPAIGQLQSPADSSAEGLLRFMELTYGSDT